MKRVKSRKTEALITRWTKEQKRALVKKARSLGMPINELLERKAFDLPLEKHPAEIA